MRGDPRIDCNRLAYGIARRAAELVGPEPELQATVAATVAALPEAPASANVRLQIGGREVQITLRDTSEDRLIARLEVVLARFPQETPSPHGQDLCPIHHVPMRDNHKNGHTWKSHRTADGWCKGR